MTTGRVLTGIVDRLPTERGGWWHEYVCPVHGIELDHGDLLTAAFPAAGAACAGGCTIDTPAVRGAWLVLSHQAWARRIRLLAHAGHRDQAVRLLTQYATTYADHLGTHGQAQSWMLPGRLFQQALTEAIWAVSVGHAVWTLAGTGAEELVAVLPMLDDLAAQAWAGRDILVGDGKFRSNYTAWLNAAGAVTSQAAALVRGHAPDPGPWLDGAHGLFAHLLVATGPDGWEWEASTYYHGFVLRAALLALRGSDPVRWPAAFRQRLESMVEVLALTATDGGVLPALHDGPYRRPALALEWLEIAALAGQVWPGCLTAVAARARHDAGPADDGLDTHLDGWFTGAPAVWPARQPDPVTVFSDAGYAVVRATGVHAVLDFGPHGGSHGHRDKLALYLYGETDAWQPDPGQVPYGHRALRAYYTSTAAHPAFSVDGLEQQECAGRLAMAGPHTAIAAANDCYPGVTARRAVTAGPGYLLDILELTAEEPAALALHLRPDCPLTAWLTEGGVLRTRWQGEDVLHGTHLCTAQATPLVNPWSRAGGPPGPPAHPPRLDRAGRAGGVLLGLPPRPGPHRPARRR